MKKQIKYELNPWHMICPTTHDDARDFAISLTHGINSFVSGGDLLFRPHNVQSWILFLGVNFMILVFLSNYTGIVTAIAVHKADIAEFTSFQDAIDHKDVRFCGWSSTEEPLVALYSSLEGRYVSILSGDVFTAMDRGECEAAIIDTDAWKVAQGGLYSTAERGIKYARHPNGPKRYHCDTKLMLPEVLYSIEIALPIRLDLHDAFSWAIVKEKEAGRWNRIHELAHDNFVWPNACLASEESESEGDQLTFTSTSGVVFISLILTSLSLAWNALYRTTSKQRAQRRAWLHVYRDRLARQPKTEAQPKGASGKMAAFSKMGGSIKQLNCMLSTAVASASEGQGQSTSRPTYNLGSSRNLQSHSSVADNGTLSALAAGQDELRSALAQLMAQQAETSAKILGMMEASPTSQQHEELNSHAPWLFERVSI